MRYEQAIELIKTQDKVRFEIIFDVIANMSEYELGKLPVIEPDVREAIRKYGWCFSIFPPNRSSYLCLYFMGSIVFRDEKVTELSNE